MLRFLKKIKFYNEICRKIHKGSEVKHRKPPWKILFFGNDNFSLYTLESLYREQKKENSVISVLNVVTNSKENPVWRYSERNKIHINNWPPHLSPNQYDLGLVVSFGYLIPESIINAFPLGMLNVHASLLPRWRGAAPIIYALAKGDRETGITVMRIKPKKFDVGDIIMQKKIPLSESIEMPELHEKLGKLGAECLIDTINNLQERLSASKPQASEGVTNAPKINSDFAKINWEIMSSRDIYNLQRALKTVLPIWTTWNSIPVKVIDVDISQSDQSTGLPGYVRYDRATKLLKVECADGSCVSVKKIGILGKKVMSAIDFNNGYLKKHPVGILPCFK